MHGSRGDKGVRPTSHHLGDSNHYINTVKLPKIGHIPTPANSYHSDPLPLNKILDPRMPLIVIATSLYLPITNSSLVLTEKLFKWIFFYLEDFDFGKKIRLIWKISVYNQSMSAPMEWLLSCKKFRFDLLNFKFNFYIVIWIYFLRCTRSTSVKFPQEAYKTKSHIQWKYWSRDLHRHHPSRGCRLRNYFIFCIQTP